MKEKLADLNHRVYCLEAILGLFACSLMPSLDNYLGKLDEK